MADATILAGERYEVQGHLGSGGMGAVYLVKDQVRGETLALKLLAEAGGLDEASFLRFKQEFRMMAGLSHPGLCAVYDFGRLPDSTPYFTMEHVPGAELEIGKVPPKPVKRASLVVVPVSGMSRLTAEGISAAMSLGDEVIAVTVVYTDADEEPQEAADVAFRAEWEAWRPEVPLLALRSAHRSLAKPIVAYLRSVEAEDKYHRLVVLIPEVEPARPSEWILHNQRGIILDRAIRRDTSNVVLCRLRYRLATLTRTPQ